MRRFGLSFLPALLLASCGSTATPPAGTALLASDLSVHADGGGVSIYANGHELGSYYVIGNCLSGGDDPDTNVTSLGSDGHTLTSPAGTCAGTPFHIWTEGTNPVRISVEVGPLPQDFRAVSAPFDANKSIFDRFLFSGSGYLVGCANSWQPRSGNSGTFASVPTPCYIPVAGPVGVARVTSAPDGGWGEISGPVATVRRTVLASNLRERVFINHPHTNNVELSWASEPISSFTIPAGSVLHVDEELAVYEAGAPPDPGTGPAPAPAGWAVDALDLLYRALLWRDADPSGIASFAPRVESQGRAGMKSVAGEILLSPEFQSVRASHSSLATLHQMYQGLFARNADPSGQADYLPLIDAGDHAPVVDAMIDSPEFAGLHPWIP